MSNPQSNTRQKSIASRAPADITSNNIDEANAVCVLCGKEDDNINNGKAACFIYCTACIKPFHCHCARINSIEIEQLTRVWGTMVLSTL